MIGHPGGGEPIAVEEELAWTVTEGEFGATEAVVEEIILGFDAFSVGGEAEERGAFGASGDDGIMEEVKRALAIPGELPAIAAVVDDLVIGGVVEFDEGIIIDPRVAIGGVVAEFGGAFGIDEIESAVSAFDPIIADDETGASVLEIIA